MMAHNTSVIRFKVNGNDISYDGPDMKLLPYLRDHLRLTGAKDGCSEGACGACTVIVQGKATKSCVMSLSRLEGKEIITIEGLTDREKAVYGFCFAECGAVQCGLLHPGNDHVHQSVAGRQSIPHRSGSPQGGLRQYLPVYRLPENH
jgi:aerobic-type carbon monoxide dehydrogenase small subunit (CoxS/CutS family)